MSSRLYAHVAVVLQQNSMSFMRTIKSGEQVSSSTRVEYEQEIIVEKSTGEAFTVCDVV